MRRVVLLCAICAGVLHLAIAQDSIRVKPLYLHSGKIGLGIDGITGSPNLLMKYFFNNQLAMQIIIGLDIDQPGNTPPAGTSKVIGMAIRGGLSLIYHITHDVVSPYAGAEALFQYEKSGGFFAVVPDPKNSVLASGVFGAECFLNERFTVGMKQGLGVTVQLKRETPREGTDIKFSTSTVVTGRFYFN